MTNSAELRWFYRGNLPPDVKEWFCGSRLCRDEEVRTDHYLVFENSAEVGVKLRDGKVLEIKARLRSPIPWSLPGTGPLGRIDAWAKWKDDDPALVGHLAQLRFGDRQWVTVIKDRWLRKFAVTAAGIEEVDAKDLPKRGVTLEVTGVLVNDQHWWTVAFESFGDILRPEDVDAVADHFLKLLPKSLVLIENDSMSYPEWLNRVARG